MEHSSVALIRRLAVLLLAGALVGCSATVVPSTSASIATASMLPSAGIPSSSQSPTPSTPSPTLPPIPPGAVPILYYHRVEAVPPDFATWDAAQRRSFLAYDALPVAFAAQLDWLVNHGYTAILPRDLAAHWDSGVALPAKPVIITFDDGDPSWLTTVLPALRQRGMVAEFYLTLDAIALKKLQWSDVRQLAAAGCAIGAHDVHHVQLAGLAGGRALPADVMWHEISDIRSVIETQVGTAPDSMAYVGGGFNPTLVRLVQQAGYTTARSILRGIVQTQANRFTLRVVRVGVNDDVIDPVQGTLVDGLPTFTARMHGVSDLRP